ncbi:MAG TPA: LysR family transcriptional regulator [Verrucomicrobiae bacterium]|nr:LysR family transcriptional regulator [Verrucomicrobiae bacterium]
MNIHHLELFYYVARHGGIMEAVRKIPYGIQQPAVSGQIAQLEEHLGVTLFQRRPFQLTPEGDKLFAFIQPFFANLDAVAAELQGGQARHIRIGASAIILREHLPELVRGVREKFAGLRISLREGFPAQLEELLQTDAIDLAVTLIDKKPPSGLHTLALLELPLVLLVARNSPLKSAEELWKRDKIDETLISLPQTESVCKNFQKRLVELGVDWFPGIETSSGDLIETYVANGLGIGLVAELPKKPASPQVRALRLDDFPPAVIGCVWRGKKTPLIEMFLEEAQKRAKQFGGK